MFRKHLSFKFGRVPVEEIFKSIFIIGLIPIVISGLVFTFKIGIGLGSPGYVIPKIGSVVAFFPRIILSCFIIFFFVLIIAVFWKLICELLFLVFKSLEVYIKKNS